MRSSEKKIIEPCTINCSFCFLNYTDILCKNYLFRNLDNKEIGDIIRKVHHHVRTYRKGDPVASGGDEYNSLFILVKGAVVGELIDFEGKVIRVEELKAPETLASAFIFGDRNQLPVNITAIEETRLLVIPRAELLSLMKKNGQILLNFLNIMANRTQHLSKKIRLLGLQSIKGKIAHYLLELETKTGSPEIKLPNSQKEMADMFGVTRPSIGRVMREMHHQGSILASGKYVTIINKSKLSELLT